MQSDKLGIRPEIQALRAIAVLMVLVYHFWPNALPGGYAGVDVFFVISGYLITSHLLRELGKTGRIDLPRFWARRARRLLPASLLVLPISAIGTWLLVPVTFWQDWFKQMGTAVAYVLNWFLAADSVDYLAAENNASPVQHYWSLSVEEQFYLVWPILIVVTVWVGARRISSGTAIALVLAIVTAGSLTASICLTLTSPASAYFVTTTRAWEFGVGGLLTFVPVIASQALRSGVAWTGVMGIVLTALTYTSETPFPGYMALLPVLATAAVIWAGTTSIPWSVAHLSRFRPVQYTGDISYSLYLWHWPLIVLMPFAVLRELTAVDSAGLLAISYVLAALTKRLVEDPARTATVLTARRPSVTLVATAAAMALVVAVPAAGFLNAREQQAESLAAVADVMKSHPDCFGAEALMNDACGDTPLGDALVPGLAAVKADTTMAYDCYNNTPQNGKVLTCSYGSNRADATRVAVTGDSHGAMLVAGLHPYLDELNWTLDTYVSRGCTWAEPSFDSECAEYRENLATDLAGGEYDVILTTAFRNATATPEEVDTFAAARAAAWAQVLDAGTRVAVVADNPRVPDDMVDCVATRPSGAVDGEDCIIPTSQLYSPVDSGPAAAALEPRANLIETADLFCTDEGCPMVIGNANVYRDQHHVTSTYIVTAAPYLAARVKATLR